MRRPYNTLTSFLDLLMNILLGFFVLLIFAVLLINPKAKNKDVELRAEMLITMEWDSDSDDDVDLFVLSPTKQVTFFGNRNTKLINLDRDDRGRLASDSVRLDDGTLIEVEDNWEHATVRKNIPGEFIVNVLLYKRRSTRPITVSVKVEKLNPYRVIYSKKVILSYEKEEITIVRFTLSKDGRVSGISSVQESLLNKVKTR